MLLATKAKFMCEIAGFVKSSLGEARTRERLDVIVRSYETWQDRCNKAWFRKLIRQ